MDCTVKMPLHDYIREVYETVEDPAYVIRFINYLVELNYPNPTFSIDNNTVVPLVMGVLENVSTKERYVSFADFYSKVTGLSVDIRETDFLRAINVTPTYSLWRVLCRYKEKDVLGFYDIKYRTFLMYKNIVTKVSQCEKLYWGNYEFQLNPTKLVCDTHPHMVHEFLEAYEDSRLYGVYYGDDSVRYLII